MAASLPKTTRTLKVIIIIHMSHLLISFHSREQVVLLRHIRGISMAAKKMIRNIKLADRFRDR